MRNRKLFKAAALILLCGLLTVSCDDKDKVENKGDTPPVTEQTDNVPENKEYDQVVDGFRFEIKETPLVETIAVTDFVPGDYYGIYSMTDGIFAAAGQDLSIGLIDGDGNVIMPCEYATRRQICDGVAAVRAHNGMWGYFNVEEKRFILDCEYESVIDFSEGLGCYFDGEVYRYINKDGTVVLDGEYFEAAAFKDGYARVLCPEGFGYMDKTGHVIIQSDYVNFDDFHEGFARVQDEGVFGYIDKTGELKYNMDCTSIFNFKDGAAAFIANGKVGYINTEGVVIIEPTYGAPTQKLDEYFRFECGVSPIMENGKYGFINGKGEIVVEPIYDLAHHAVENTIRVLKDGLYGYVRTDGTVITDCIFEEAGAFNEGVACVKKDDMYYFINKDGKELTSERFDDATNVTGGTAFVVKPGTFTWSKVTFGEQ